MNCRASLQVAAVCGYGARVIPDSAIIHVVGRTSRRTELYKDTYMHMNLCDCRMLRMVDRGGLLWHISISWPEVVSRCGEVDHALLVTIAFVRLSVALYNRNVYVLRMGLHRTAGVTDSAVVRAHTRPVP